MKNISQVFTMLFLLVSSTLFATQNTFTLSLAGVAMATDYREYDDSNDILDSEISDYPTSQGMEVALKFELNKTDKKAHHLNLNYLYISGTTDYVGSVIGSGLGYGSKTSTTNNYIIDTSISYYYEMMFSKSFSLFLGTGLGYYSWERELSATQKEVYTWSSIKPIIGAGYDILDSLNLCIFYEKQFAYNTKMTSSSPILDLTLGGVDIDKFSIPLTYMHSKDVEFFTEYVYMHQVIQKSNTQNGYYEPDSTANNSYVKAGININF